MTYKQIEASREARLWLGQVIIPALTGAGLLLSNPTIRKAAKTKLEAFKNKIQANKS